MMQVKLIGDKRVSRMMLNLGPELNKMINRAGKEWLESVQKGAKWRAPNLTGSLVRSIVIRKSKNGYILSVDSPYGRYVESGYKPHLVSSSAPTKSGGTIASVYGIPSGVTLLVTGSRRPHFVRDAFQSAIPRLPKYLSNSTKKAIKRARR